MTKKIVKTKAFVKTRQIAFLSVLLTGLIVPTFAQAEIYKTVDANGNVTYSNVKLKGAKKLDLEPADTSFGTNSSSGSSSEGKRTTQAKTPTPASFPKVDSGTQNQRDGKRKEILQGELDAEKKALDDAKKAYAEGESNPEMSHVPRQVTTVTGHDADGKAITKTTTVVDQYRNVAKFQEKMKSLQADVDAHQRNIDLLQKELNTTN